MVYDEELVDIGIWICLLLAAVWGLKWLAHVLVPSRQALPAGSRVVVVGGGIAGCSTAWAMARSGYRVTLVEKQSRIGGNAKIHRWPNGVITG